MPSLRSRLSAAWLAFHSPELVEAGMQLETESFETGIILGRAAAQKGGFAVAMPSERFVGYCGRATQRGLLS